LHKLASSASFRLLPDCFNYDLSLAVPLDLSNLKMVCILRPSWFWFIIPKNPVSKHPGGIAAVIDWGGKKPPSKSHHSPWHVLPTDRPSLSGLSFSRWTNVSVWCYFGVGRVRDFLHSLTGNLRLGVFLRVLTTQISTCPSTVVRYNRFHVLGRIEANTLS